MQILFEIKVTEAGTFNCSFTFSLNQSLILIKHHNDALKFSVVLISWMHYFDYYLEKNAMASVNSWRCNPVKKTNKSGINYIIFTYDSYEIKVLNSQIGTCSYLTCHVWNIISCMWKHNFLMCCFVRLTLWRYTSESYRLTFQWSRRRLVSNRIENIHQMTKLLHMAESTAANLSETHSYAAR